MSKIIAKDSSTITSEFDIDLNRANNTFKLNYFTSYGGHEFETATLAKCMNIKN